MKIIATAATRLMSIHKFRPWNKLDSSIGRRSPVRKCDNASLISNGEFSFANIQHMQLQFMRKAVQVILEHCVRAVKNSLIDVRVDEESKV